MSESTVTALSDDKIYILHYQRIIGIARRIKHQIYEWYFLDFTKSFLPSLSITVKVTESK